MNTTQTTENMAGNVPELLRRLRLPTMASELAEATKRAEANDWTPKAFLGHLAYAEVEARRVRRVARNLKASHLPPGKTLDTLNLKRYALKVRRQVGTLVSGNFLDQAENVLLFGLPGRGKSHMAIAIGYEMVQRGYKVLFTPTYQLVQRLLIAKRELQLEKLLCRLDKFDCVILDDGMRDRTTGSLFNDPGVGLQEESSIGGGRKKKSRNQSQYTRPRHGRWQERDQDGC